MIGAVQILAIGYKQAELPSRIVRQINLLRSSEAVSLLDVYAVKKAKDRTLTEVPIEEIDGWDGELIRSLLRSAGARRVFDSYVTDSSGFLVQGTSIPDLRISLPEGTTVVILLIEHIWARTLEEAMRDGSTFPLAGGWAGREALEEAGLSMDAPAG